MYNMSIQLGGKLGRPLPLIAINFDFLFPPIDSPNTPKEFPSYHELCSSQIIFSFVLLDVRCFHCAHFSYQTTCKSSASFSFHFLAVRLIQQSTEYDNKIYESQSMEMNILWTKFLKFHSLILTHFLHSI